MESWRQENCLIYICVSAMTIGLYALSHSWHALWSFILLLFANSGGR